MIVCEECGKEFSKHGIGSHIWRVHGKGKGFAPTPTGTKQIWNKGLTKETSEPLRRRSETLAKRLEDGTIKLGGWKHTVESKKKISEARIKYIDENPDKAPYKMYHSSKKSYPEIQFENALISKGIEGWEYNYQHGRFTYDFGFPEFKLDVEIDGNTHLLEDVLTKDKIRDDWSEGRGWAVLRFTAKEVKHDLQGCINKLEGVLNTM